MSEPIAEPDEGDQESVAPNREAAKWRTQLRQAEAERDAFSQQITSLQKRDALRIAAASLAQAADLFDIGAVELAALLDEDGSVDAAKVETACADLLATRPGLKRISTKADYEGGARGTPSRPVSLGDLLQSAVRGRR